MDDSGHFQLFCDGRTTGDQNRRPVARKDACSAPCHICDRRPSINTEGICHTTNVPAAANQQIAGCVTTLANRCIGSDRNRRPTTCKNRCNKPSASGFRGMPSKIKGGARFMRRRCCTMCAVSISWSSAARGEAVAIQMNKRPNRKLPARQPSLPWSWLRRPRHPRK